MQIQDKTGRDYRLRISIDDMLWRIDVLHGIVPVGILFAMPMEDALRLQDIRIFAEVLHPENMAFGFMRQFLGIKRTRRNYRGKGIGSELLLKLIELGRSHGFTEIFGEIKRGDFNNNPELPDWYRRHGFVVKCSSQTPPFHISLKFNPH